MLHLMIWNKEIKIVYGLFLSINLSGKMDDLAYIYVDTLDKK